MKDILWILLYANDLAVIADREANLQEQLVEWRDVSGLGVGLEDEGGAKINELEIHLDG